MSSCYRSTVGGVPIAARCAPALAPRVDALFAHLEGLRARGTRLREGATLSYGSSLLALFRARGDVALELHEPDYDGDPFTATRADVTVTLACVDGQLELLARAAAPARTTMFWETLLVARGALEARRVYLERRVRAGVRDSGWTLGPLDGDGDGGDGELETRFVHELLSRRPALASALAFPEGWLVVFDGGRAHAILDPAGVQAWPTTKPRARGRAGFSA